MQKIKILIVEDELIIAGSLKLMVENLGFEVSAIYSSGVKMLDDFKAGAADIIIMDIHLAGKLNGIETAIGVGKISKAPIIFITNNNDDLTRKLAINKTNAVYYINKPFDKTDIAAAIDFALKAIKDNADNPGDSAQQYILNDCIFIKNSNGFGYKKILINEIIFLKAEGNYCEFKHKDGSIILSENLSFFEEKLSFAKELVRVHRSYIVNINFIDKVQENTVWIDKKEIPIGKTYRDVIRNIFRFI